MHIPKVWLSLENNYQAHKKESVKQNNVGVIFFSRAAIFLSFSLLTNGLAARNRHTLYMPIEFFPFSVFFLVKSTNANVCIDLIKSAQVAL